MVDEMLDSDVNEHPMAEQISEDDKLNLKSEMVVEHNLDNFRAKFLSTTLSLGCILSQLLSFLVLMIPRLVGY
ncbi:hypothetical protein LIER_29140 [Lithospermum erythrorhizon]|uniref:Uncharacterized protein n=1 Tax=Lithospermum erythrorhizon TaxID=34254 RepID=A0AAV3RLT0_LITER